MEAGKTRNLVMEKTAYFLRPGCSLSLGLYYGPPRYPRQIMKVPVTPALNQVESYTFFVHILN